MLELGRSEEVIREMDKLANEDYTHHATAEEISVNRNNWCGFRHAPIRRVVNLASPQESRG